MARKLEKAQAKHSKERDELAKLEAQMEKMRANCPHDDGYDKREDGVIICRVCRKEVAYPKGSPQLAGDDYGEYDEE